MGGSNVATIIHLGGARRSIDTVHDERVRSWLVATMLVALAVVLGAPPVGFGVAGIFAVGMILAQVERRSLRPVEFVVIASLHAAAVLLLAI